MSSTKKTPILADLHTHLNEKRIKPQNWWRAVEDKNLSIVAITEHSNYKPKEAYLKLKYTQPEGIILIPGMEARTTAGDLLIYGTDETLYDISDLLKKDIPIKKALAIVKENNLVASFAHPHGYKMDSTCEVIGEKETIRLIKKYKVGTEYYNGMLASANELLFGRNWVKNFYKVLSFVDANRATHALKINKTTSSTKKKMEMLAAETIERVRKGMLLGEKASFVTVGSDAHYPHSIGSSIIELKRKPKNEKEFLLMIQKKETLWKGPNIYSTLPVDIIGRKEMIEGLTYLTKKKILSQKKNPFVGKIRKKIRLSKRIKTIKRLSNKANLTKIRTKLPKIKLKKKIKAFRKKWAW